MSPVSSPEAEFDLVFENLADLVVKRGKALRLGIPHLRFRFLSRYFLPSLLLPQSVATKTVKLVKHGGTTAAILLDCSYNVSKTEHFW